MYEVNDDGESVTITGYEGSETALEIPSEMDGKRVESIGDEAFYRCSGLEEVSISEGVKSIGAYAFGWCSGLEEVRIPGSVESIGNAAFSVCDGLEEVSIPGSVERIGDSAFSGCRGLEEVRISEGVKSIGVFAFGYCSRLEEVSITGSVESIGDRAFYFCGSLREVSIPSSVRSIGVWAFSNCDGLKEVSIPSSVESIGTGAYSFCDSLMSIAVEDGNEVYDSRENCNAIIESSTNELLQGCQRTVIPNSVGSIGDEAFLGCSGLTEVSIPGSVERIGDRAFYCCGSLREVIIPSSVRSIGVWAFGYENVMSGSDPYPNCSIYGEKGSEAERYAKENGFLFIEKVISPAPSPIACPKTLYQVAYGAKPFSLGAAYEGTLTYRSSNPKVASVDGAGKVSVKGTGIAVVTVSGGSESVSVTVKVSPKQASLKSAKAAKGRSLTVKWAKDRRATGYQVELSLRQNFKKTAKKKKLTGVTCTFTKLKAGSRYYVRIRSFKKVGKELLYGAWSRPKRSGKVKK